MQSFSCMFLYTSPVLLSVPPSRHWRFSRVEVVLDVLFLGIWVGASSVIAWFGDCPRHILEPPSKNVSCVPWNLCMALGYLCCGLFLLTFFLGIRDLRTFGWGYRVGTVNGIGRGHWSASKSLFGKKER